MIKRVIGATAALAAGLFGALALSTPAQAVEQPEVTHYQAEPCSEVVVSAAGFKVENIADDKWLPWLVVYDGAALHVAKLFSGESTVTLAAFSSPGAVQYRVFGGGESDHHLPAGGWAGVDAWIKGDDGPGSYDALTADALALAPPELFAPWHHTAQVAGCVTPEEPTVTQFDCATDATAGELVIPTQDGVVYDTESGPVPPGTYPVSASPAAGFAFPADAATQWELVVNAVNGCPGEPGTPGEPGEPGTPGGSGGSTDGDSLLPVTGSATTVVAAVGAGTVALGGTLAVLSVLWGRRRRRSLLDGLAE